MRALARLRYFFIGGWRCVGFLICDRCGSDIKLNHIGLNPTGTQPLTCRVLYYFDCEPIIKGFCYSAPNWVVNTNHTYKVWEIQIFDDRRKKHK
jgi:hypothetical protein